MVSAWCTADLCRHFPIVFSIHKCMMSVYEPTLSWASLSVVRLSLRVKACLLLPLPRSHAPCTSRCISGSWTDAFLQPLWSMCRVALAHFSLLTFAVLLPSDRWCFQTLPHVTPTPTCHPSPLLPQCLAPGPATSPAPFLTVCVLLLKYLAPTPAYKHLLPGWKYISLAV